MSDFDVVSEISVQVSGEPDIRRLSQALEDAGYEAEQIEGILGNVSIQMKYSGDAAKRYSAQVKQMADEIRKMNKFDQRKTLGGLDSQTSADVRAAMADLNAIDRAVEVNKNKTIRAEQQKVDALINTRYALYDTAAAWRSVSIGLAAGLAATVGSAASFEKSFASVARTTGATGVELEALRDSLVDLSTSMPTSFGDLSNIATIGAQLGVATGAIDEFTNTVAKFSATTDVSVDETAMSIGRIAQLTGTSAADYERLASTIYQTGVTAVATEGEILGVATEIATAGDLAGLAQSEIIALASSLASLGIAPEGARGSIMRLFGAFDNAVADGGKRLADFARLSGMTADQFAKAWSESPQEALSAFVAGMDNAVQAGGKANIILRDLGINQVRDQKLVALLANNQEVYNTALAQTSAEWASGQSLADGYAQQTDNLIDNLKVLANSLMALGASAGGPAVEALNIVAKAAIDVANGLRVINETGVGQVLSTITVAIIASTAAFAAYKIVISLARGNIAAMASSMLNADKSATKLNMGLIGLTKSFIMLSQGSMDTARSIAGVGAASESTAVKLTAMQRAASAAGVGVKALQAGLVGFARAVPGLAAISLAFAGISKAISAYENSTKSASEKAAEYFGDTSNLVDAMRQDIEAGDASMGEFTVTADVSSDSLAWWATKINESHDGLLGLSDQTKVTSESTKTFTQALGANTEAALQNLIITKLSETLKEYGEALMVAGFDLDAFLVKLRQDPTGVGALDYLNTFAETSDATFANLKAQFEAGDITMAEYQDRLTGVVQQAGGDLMPALDSLRTMVGHAATAFHDGQVEVATAAAVNKAFAASAEDAADGAADAAGAAEDLGGAAGDWADGIKQIMGAVDAAYAVQDAFDNLGESMGKNGLDFSAETEAGRANMQALQGAVNALAVQAGDDSMAFDGGIVSLIGGMQDAGVVAGEELDWMLQLLNQTVGTQYGINFSTAAARQNIHKFIADLARAQQLAVNAMNMQLQNTTFMAPEHKAQLEADLAAASSKLNGLLTAQNQLATASDESSVNTNTMANAMERARRSSGGTAKNAGKTAKNAKDAKKEIRTLVDYANDLSGVLNRAFEIRFGVGQAKREVRETIADIRKDIREANWPSIDELLSSKKNRTLFSRGEAKDAAGKLFIDLKKAAEDARKAVIDAAQAVQDAKTTLSGLRTDEATLLYWKGIATMYGDVERLAEIEAELAENRNEQAKATQNLADANKELADAQAKASNKSLKGNSEQAISNRSDVRDLVKGQLEYIQALKDSGASQSTITKAVNQAYADFMAQGAALGYNVKELGSYGSAIKDADAAASGTAMTQSEIASALEEVTKGYLETAVAMAKNGASQKEINAYLDQGRREVEKLAKEMGATPATIKKILPAFADFKKVLASIPKNVNVNIKALTPGEAAVKEFLAKYNNQTVNVKAQGSGKLGAPAGGWPRISVPVQADDVKDESKKPMKVKSASVLAMEKYMRDFNINTGKVGNVKGSKLSLSGNVSAWQLAVQNKVTTPYVNVSKGLTGPINGTRPTRWGGALTNSPGPAYRAKGGGFPGTQRGRDVLPVWMDPQEFVFSREAKQLWGTDMLSQMNRGIIPKEFIIPVHTPVPVAGNSPHEVQLMEMVPNQFQQIITAVVQSAASDPNFAAYVVQAQEQNRLNNRQGKG